MGEHSRLPDLIMKLTASQFLHILDTLRSDPLRGQRNSPRVGLRCRATMVPCTESASVTRQEVWIKDLSVEGVGFVTEELLELGSYVVIQFASDGRGGVSVLYRVTRCLRVGPKSVEIGGHLDHVLSDEELSAT